MDVREDDALGFRFQRGQCFSLLPGDLEDRLGQRCAVIGEGAGVCLVNDGCAFLEGVVGFLVIVDQRLTRAD